MFEQVINEKIITLLQFAKKSGSVVLGHDAVIKMVRTRKVYYILIADDLSENTIHSVLKTASMNKVTVDKFGNKELFLSIFGKYTGIIGITDENFKKGLIKYISSGKDD